MSLLISLACTSTTMGPAPAAVPRLDELPSPGLDPEWWLLREEACPADATLEGLIDFNLWCQGSAGRLHGPTTEFWGGGVKAHEGRLAEGRRQGAWLSWDQEGGLVGVEVFESGVLVQRWELDPPLADPRGRRPSHPAAVDRFQGALVLGCGLCLSGECWSRCEELVQRAEASEVVQEGEEPCAFCESEPCVAMCASLDESMKACAPVALERWRADLRLLQGALPEVTRPERQARALALMERGSPEELEAVAAELEDAQAAATLRGYGAERPWSCGP